MIHYIMSSNIKISIIVPVYNVEKYLSECLDSCINQTLKEIEIICIDDCSTDGSLKLLKQYAALDDRIQIIEQTENKRQGAARNLGIKAAHGEYIWFVDSDDYIALEACQLLYDTAKRHNVDILCFDAINVVSHDGKPDVLDYSSYYFSFPQNTVLNPQKDSAFIREGFPVSPCIYISRRTFVYNFSFREKCFYEDTDFTPILFATASSLFCITYTAYYRRIRKGSTTTNPPSVLFVEDKKKVVFSLKAYIEKHKIPETHFLHRFFSGFSSYVAELICTKDVFCELGLNCGDVVAIYGAGNWGKVMYDRFSCYGIQTPFFFDVNMDKQKCGFCGVPVKSPAMLSDYKGVLFVAVKGECTVIAQKISAEGRKDLHIIVLDDYIRLSNKKKSAYMKELLTTGN